MSESEGASPSASSSALETTACAAVTGGLFERRADGDGSADETPEPDLIWIAPASIWEREPT
eukprot:11116001-Alexandrium_andersonii.AAC.1